jgi:predicted TIM-barrel fold metal-dependent hydrolase
MSRILHEGDRSATDCACGTSRRGFLTRIGGLAAASALPGGTAAAADPTSAPAQRIDVHHHFWSPSYLAALKKANLNQLLSQTWTPEKSLADMDGAGVATSILSVTTPGVSFADGAAARGVTRESNEYAAKLISSHPGRFGLFAMLPLADTDGSLREIEYALDVLKADGIGLMTSYGTKWLGDPSFWPVLQELNRRKAVVYTHPITAPCCRGLIKEINDSIIEFGTDTSRTIASLVFTGTSARYPDIQWIFSHAGGTMPFLAERFTRLPLLTPEVKPNLTNGVLPELKRFHYDTAQAAHPPALAALTRLIPTSQILFGTDYPYRTSADHVNGLAQFGFSAGDLQAIDRDNAVRLLPRWRAAG